MKNILLIFVMLCSFGLSVFANQQFLDAASKGNAREVERYINSRGNLNVKDRSGNTALILASINNHSEVARILLSARPDLNVRNNDNRTALMYAAEKGNNEIVRQLVAYQADTSGQVKSGKFAGYSALMLATAGRHTEVVRMLVAAQANPNVKADGGWTALLIASENGSTEIVRMLIASRADVNARLQGGKDNGKTALDFAIRGRHREIENMLKSAGAR